MQGDLIDSSNQWLWMRWGSPSIAMNELFHQMEDSIVVLWNSPAIQNDSLI